MPGIALARCGSFSAAGRLLSGCVFDQRGEWSRTVVTFSHSFGGDRIEDEVNKAFAEERSTKGIVLFPIRIDDTVISTDESWAVKLRDQRKIGDFGNGRRPPSTRRS
jgi:hypothetical protein